MVKLAKSVFEVSGESQVILGQLEKEVRLVKKGLKEIQVETVVLGKPESKGKLDRKEIRVKWETSGQRARLEIPDRMVKSDSQEIFHEVYEFKILYL